MDNPITISNDGARIVATNFWDSEIEHRGMFFFSTNAGTMRLLMPRNQYPALLQMQSAKAVVITRGGYEGRENTLEVMFDDGSDDPYCLWLDPEEADQFWTPDDERKPCPFVVYVPPGEIAWETHCHLRRAPELPYMRPWEGGT